MKIAISGATGFIGTHLTRYLSGQGHEVTGLGRKWFGRGNADHLAKLMEGMDVVINLAGAPVNHRWTTAYKQELYDSRIIPTRMLVDAIKKYDMDLVVCGHHQDFWSKLMSSARQLINTVHVDMLIVPLRDEEDE